MRVTQSMVYSRLTSQINQQQANLADTQEKISSGKAVLRPSDDPARAAALSQVGSKVHVIERYQTNLDRAIGVMDLQETALDGMADEMLRVKELLVQGSNDIYNSKDRETFAVEIDQIINQLVVLANRRGADGSYLFSGYLQHRPPFEMTNDGVVYHGNDEVFQVPVDEGMKLDVGIPGSDLLGSVKHRDPETGEEEDIGLFSYLKETVQALRDNDDTKIQSSLDEMDTLYDHVTMTKALVGARLSYAADQKEMHEERLRGLKVIRSQLEDLNYVDAVSKLKTETLALEAGQKSFAQFLGLSLFNHI